MSPASPPPWPATCAPSSTAATPSAASSPWTSSPRPTTSSASRSWSDQRGAMSDELEKPLGVMGKQEQRPPVPDRSSLIAPPRLRLAPAAGATGGARPALRRDGGGRGRDDPAGRGPRAGGGTARPRQGRGGRLA